jgi:hypothetical protein
MLVTPLTVPKIQPQLLSCEVFALISPEAFLHPTEARQSYYQTKGIRISRLGKDQLRWNTSSYEPM